jgi:tetratricopeptide (TPR) repeat protein
MFSAVISSDLMISDITSDNANVFYELGIRHALGRGRTILISAAGRRIPGNISSLRALFYEPDANGRLTGSAAEMFREQLKSIIREGQRSPVSDSPIYQFFPDLDVSLPAELDAGTGRRRRRTKGQRGFVQSVVESPAQAKGDLEGIEAAVRGSQEVDPGEYLNLMKRYRDLSEWDRVIGLADDAPPQLAESQEMRQLLALALNRRGLPGDQDRAITMMEQQLAETGGDSESFGILGRIYKDRYDQAKEQGDPREASVNLEKAIEQYRAGFEKNPRDYYPGINVVNLLVQKGDDAARQELDTLVPRVSAAVQQKLEGDRIDFWDLATDLQLAAVARDWSRAEQRAKAMVSQSPAGWMVETTIRDMRAVGKTFSDPMDQRSLESIIWILKPDARNGGAE